MNSNAHVTNLDIYTTKLISKYITTPDFDFWKSKITHFSNFGPAGGGHGSLETAVTHMTHTCHELVCTCHELTYVHDTQKYITTPEFDFFSFGAAGGGTAVLLYSAIIESRSGAMCSWYTWVRDSCEYVTDINSWRYEFVRFASLWQLWVCDRCELVTMWVRDDVSSWRCEFVTMWILDIHGSFVVLYHHKIQIWRHLFLKHTISSWQLWVRDRCKFVTKVSLWQLCDRCEFVTIWVCDLCEYLTYTVLYNNRIQVWCRAFRAHVSSWQLWVRDRYEFVTIWILDIHSSLVVLYNHKIQIWRRVLLIHMSSWQLLSMWQMWVRDIVSSGHTRQSCWISQS